MKTVLATGGGGYIGSWVTKELLEKGYAVKVSVRDISKTDKYGELKKIAETEKGTLEFVEANLTDDGAFDEIVKGCDAVIHMASPFNINPKDPQKDLVDPALKGTRNVLQAANKSDSVKRVVLTSSTVAVYGDACDPVPGNREAFNEEDWNTTSTLRHQPYAYSKVLAEKEAWKIASPQDQWSLVVINPTFVMGPPIIPSSSESLNTVQQLLEGKLSMGAPELYFGTVDVRDVAHAHILALENEKAEGRHLLCHSVLTFLDYAQFIEKAFPGKYKLPKKFAPKWLLMLTGWMFGLKRKYMKNNIGYQVEIDASKSKASLGLEYRDPQETFKDMVEKFEELGMIKS